MNIAKRQKIVSLTQGTLWEADIHAKFRILGHEYCETPKNWKPNVKDGLRDRYSHKISNFKQWVLWNSEKNLTANEKDNLRDRKQKTLCRTSDHVCG